MYTHRLWVSPLSVFLHCLRAFLYVSGYSPRRQLSTGNVAFNCHQRITEYANHRPNLWAGYVATVDDMLCMGLYRFITDFDSKDNRNRPTGVEPSFGAGVRFLGRKMH